MDAVNKIKQDTKQIRTLCYYTLKTWHLFESGHNWINTTSLGKKIDLVRLLLLLLCVIYILKSTFSTFKHIQLITSS